MTYIHHCEKLICSSAAAAAGNDNIALFPGRVVSKLMLGRLLDLVLIVSGRGWNFRSNERIPEQ